MFFIPFDDWKTLFFIKVYRYSEDFSNGHVVTFFEPSVLREICILQYLGNNSTILILKFQNKFVVFIARCISLIIFFIVITFSDCSIVFNK